MKTPSRLLWLCLSCFVLLLPCGCTRCCPNNAGSPDMIPLVEKPIGNEPFVIKQTRNDVTESFTVSICVRVNRKDDRAFERRYNQSTNKISDRIVAVLYASTPEDRKEIGFETMKERVKQVINEELGEPLVQEVLFVSVVYEES